MYKQSFVAEMFSDYFCSGYLLSEDLCRVLCFLPPSRLDKNQGQELPVLARSWVVEELLNAVTSVCLVEMDS